MFQSTHPCGVRPAALPTPRKPQGCFNPRTPAGCDNDGALFGSIIARFNPRTPAGCDLQDRDGRVRSRRVSIHAPLRGATITSLFVANDDIGFNPRTPAGCDPPVCLLGGDVETFQSTHPCGVRLTGLHPGILIGRFQSTHPCGVRLRHGCHC